MVPVGKAVIVIDPLCDASGNVTTDNPTTVDVTAGVTATDQDGMQFAGKVEGTPRTRRCCPLSQSEWRCPRP